MRSRHTIRTNRVVMEESIQNIDSRKIRTHNIKKIICVLSIPLMVGLFTFVVGIIFMATGSARTSTFVLNASIVALIITTAAYIFAPSYIFSIVCYSFIVKKFGKDKYKSLWFIPFFQSGLSWFPSFLKVPPIERTPSAFFGLFLVTLLISVVWIGLIQLYIHFKVKPRLNGI